MRKQTTIDLSISLVLVLAFVALPHFYSNLTILFMMAMYMVLSQGVNLLYGLTGYMPFGYVGFFGAGAYGFSIALQHLHFPIVLALIFGVLFTSLVGVILSPLLRLSGAYFAIGNLATSQVIYGIVANSHLQGITGGGDGVDISQYFNQTASYYVMLAVLLVVMVGIIWVKRSSFGLSLQAMRDDSVSVAMSGVNVVRNRMLVWLASAAIAGLCGAIYAWFISFFYPSSVFDVSIGIFAIVFMLFGGQGTIFGPVIGTIILYGIYNVIGVSTPQYFQLAYGVLIVILVMFLPNGVLSLFKRGRRAHGRVLESRPNF
ncbi:branched-chain amino acid ABC transporter permease [Alicyclobacillus ferrooxydans]|uniref:Amino acid ABC transporter n=1 Tax=Alicyclobacillus ferrooxydans TaxID=471514 RepID=A0A0N8PPS1_9BACL|nr:branched-chain amino acid ABC transporter permease [Alicyclobacillus ferrooxydans]KPV45109.1 amino acid ABC transporter [Alicyclobacillus ferrooxydans]